MVTDNLRRVRALANHVDPARGVPAHHRPGFTVAVLGAAVACSSLHPAFSSACARASYAYAASFFALCAAT